MADAPTYARHVAEAADAWLRDPQDTQIYARLVHATLAWREYSTPTLEGLEHVGVRRAAGQDDEVRPDVDVDAGRPGGRRLSSMPVSD